MSRSQIIKDDVTRQLSSAYSTGKKCEQFSIHNIPSLQYIVTEGIGNRDIQWIRGLKGFPQIFKIFNRIRHYTSIEETKSFTMGPIEVEWDQQLGGNEYSYNVMLWVPNYVGEAQFNRAMKDVVGNIDSSIRLVNKPAGTYAQVLHHGTYQEMNEIEKKFMQDIESQGYKCDGVKKEIYMNHTNINWPDNLKIILRQKVITNC